MQQSQCILCLWLILIVIQFIYILFKWLKKCYLTATSSWSRKKLSFNATVVAVHTMLIKNLTFDSHIVMVQKTPKTKNCEKLMILVYAQDNLIGGPVREMFTLKELEKLVLYL